MDKKERAELLDDVGSVMEQKLKLHHTANGYVTNDRFDASTKVMTKTLGVVTDAVEKVHKKVEEQTRVTSALGKITSKLSTKLIEHTAEHAGEEKAEDKLARKKSMEASKWKRRLATAGLVVTVLSMLSGLGVWFVSEVKAARERPTTIVIDKETAKEIAKAVNGRGDDE